MDPRDVPILVLGFNRPDFLNELFAELRQLGPRKIYFAVDGPRVGISDDEQRVRLSRDQVKSIDWPCDVSTRFNDSNLGCGLGVSSAISWFFENEEYGIILEDDIRPDPSFFSFMAQMLEAYKNDERVFAITGTNFVPPSQIGTLGPYRFSRIPVVWGWGTWRRSWESYSLHIGGWWRGWPILRVKSATGGTWSCLAYWSAHFQLVARRKIDTWDYQAVYAAMRSGGLTVVPNVNLVDNVGFGANATHTAERPNHLRDRNSVEGGLEVSTEIVIDDLADSFHNRVIYGASPFGLLRQVFRVIVRLVRNLLGSKDVG